MFDEITYYNLMDECYYEINALKAQLEQQFKDLRKHPKKVELPKKSINKPKVKKKPVKKILNKITPKDGYKICSTCKVEKPYIEFHKHTRNKDGYKYNCKKCIEISYKIYIEKNREKIKERKKVRNKKINRIASKKPKKILIPKIKTHKICSKCKIEKPVSSFAYTNKKKLQYQGYCKECHKIYLNTYKHKFPEKFKSSNTNNSIGQKNWNNAKAYYKKQSAQSIAWHDYTECSGDGYLIVKCKYCGRTFIPSNREVDNRAYALNTKGTDTQGFYCSSGCKKACPTYNRIYTYKEKKVDGSSREVQPQLRQMCLARDNYTCQKCNAKGKTVQFHCHHIYPLNESPITSADVDECITLCKDCHKEAHKIAGCTNFELRCSKK